MIFGLPTKAYKIYVLSFRQIDTTLLKMVVEFSALLDQLETWTKIWLRSIINHSRIYIARLINSINTFFKRIIDVHV